METLSHATVISLMHLIQILDYHLNQNETVYMTANLVYETAEKLHFSEESLDLGLQVLMSEPSIETEIDEHAIYHLFYNPNLNAVVASPYWDEPAMNKLLTELDPLLGLE